MPNPIDQIDHCFGCGVSGDVFSFVMETEELGFSEAVEALARSFWCRPTGIRECDPRLLHLVYETPREAKAKGGSHRLPTQNLVYRHFGDWADVTRAGEEAVSSQTS